MNAGVEVNMARQKDRSLSPHNPQHSQSRPQFAPPSPTPGCGQQLELCLIPTVQPYCAALEVLHRMYRLIPDTAPVVLT